MTKATLFEKHWTKLYVGGLIHFFSIDSECYMPDWAWLGSKYRNREVKCIDNFKIQYQ